MNNSVGNKRRIAILGAGIMGSCMALALARHGLHVTVFDAKERPLDGASRWNEGKIHLGYLYSADPSLETARKVVTGGIHFADSLSRLLGCSIAPAFTEQDDTFLVHRDSVVSSDELKRYASAVHDLVSSHPDAEIARKWFGTTTPHRIKQAELEGLANRERVTAGFRVPERSVQTNWIADKLCEALLSNPRVELQLNCRVVSVQPESTTNGRWKVRCSSGQEETFDLVVNALWNGRLAIDRTAGLEPAGIWSNRYRVAVFGRSSKPIKFESAIVAVGPFGDVKNYNGYDYYLSWYPDGLLLDSNELEPREPSKLTAEDQERLARRMVNGLADVVPKVGELLDQSSEFTVRGGFVFARGHGSLAKRASSIHRRDHFGVEVLGRYISIDTGKYSTAPWMAERLASELTA